MSAGFSFQLSAFLSAFSASNPQPPTHRKKERKKESKVSWSTTYRGRCLHTSAWYHVRTQSLSSRLVASRPCFEASKFSINVLLSIHHPGRNLPLLRLRSAAVISLIQLSLAFPSFLRANAGSSIQYSYDCRVSVILLPYALHISTSIPAAPAPRPRTSSVQSDNVLVLIPKMFAKRMSRRRHCPSAIPLQLVRHRRRREVEEEEAVALLIQLGEKEEGAALPTYLPSMIESASGSSRLLWRRRRIIPFRAVVMSKNVI
ncbi:hypothetical protein B0H34DRAFT_714275 [Crassisporium funariophilum]|nr:hypothetical protein B0H34DRAFT_714275 [Crassisporium funariophilum]